MAEHRRTRSFFRVAKVYPPGADEYLTAEEQGRNLPVGASEAVRASWSGLSVYDSEDGARRQALKLRERLGMLVVRFDIPEDSGITFRPSFGSGHYDLYGNRDELRRYLSPFVNVVEEEPT